MIHRPPRSSPAARARTQVLIGRLTRAAVLVSTGVAAFIGVTVAREHPGGAAKTTPPSQPAPAQPGSTPAPAVPPPTAPTTTPTTAVPGAVAPTTTTVPPTTVPPTTVPPAPTTTQPVVTSGGTSAR